MPAEILYESAPGMYRVRMPDGQEAEYPADMAQQVVQASYAGGGKTDPAQTQYVGAQGAPPPQVPASGLPDEVLDAQDGILPEPNLPGEVLDAQDAAAAGSPGEITMPPDYVGQGAPPVQAPGQAAPFAVGPGESVGFKLRTPVRGAAKRVSRPPTSPDQSDVATAMYDSAAMQARGAAQETEAAMGMADVQARHQQAVSDYTRDQELVHQTAIQKANEETQQYEAQISEALAAVPTMNPGRIWSNASTFQSAMGILGAAVGGWLQVVQGGPNYALNAIQKAIDQDIQAQMVDIESARENVFRQERAYERGTERINERFMRAEEQRAFRYRSLAAAAEAEMAKFQSPIAQAKYAKFLGGLNMKVAESMANLRQMSFDNNYKVWSGYTQAALEAERIAKDWASLSFQKKAHADQMAAKKAETEPMAVIMDPTQTGRGFIVDPRVAATMDKGEFGKIRDSFSRDANALRKMRKYVARLAEVKRTYAGRGYETRFNPTAKERKELEGLREDGINAIRHATTGANLSIFEIKNWEAMMPKPTSVIGYDAVENAVNFVNRRAQDAQSTYTNTYGLREVRGIDPQGNPVFGVPNLSSEWGDIDLAEYEPVDSSGLWSRMKESAAAVQEGRAGRDTAQAVADDATEFLERARTRSSKTGITQDLATQMVKDMYDSAARIGARGDEFSAQEQQILKAAEGLKKIIESGLHRQEVPQGAGSYPIRTGGY